MQAVHKRLWHTVGHVALGTGRPLLTQLLSSSPSSCLSLPHVTRLSPVEAWQQAEQLTEPFSALAWGLSGEADSHPFLDPFLLLLGTLPDTDAKLQLHRVGKTSNILPHSGQG